MEVAAMPKLTIDDLKKIKEQHKSEFTLRDGGYRVKITVHMGTCGIAAGARDVMNVVTDEMAKSGLQDVIVTTSGCAGLCSQEPMATIEMAGHAPVKYANLTADKMREIFAEHVKEGRVVEKYALVTGSETSY
jgi:NADP-reducing hydrogenase subunit HndB